MKSSSGNFVNLVVCLWTLSKASLKVHSCWMLLIGIGVTTIAGTQGQIGLVQLCLADPFLDPGTILIGRSSKGVNVVKFPFPNYHLWSKSTSLTLFLRLRKVMQYSIPNRILQKSLITQNQKQACAWIRTSTTNLLQIKMKWKLRQNRSKTQAQCSVSQGVPKADSSSCFIIDVIVQTFSDGKELALWPVSI